ncbi:hypothetical protein JXO59_10950, partial [candidate division KSB1 bacterium]|nr:hypothetical protein [candidate division KSB1 bacterium]
MKFAVTIFSIVWFTLFTYPAAVQADSFYSSIGLGLPRYTVSAKAVGMGGAGIGVVDRLALNTMNPAANNIEGMTSLGVNLEYEYVENKNSLESIYTRYGNAAGMQFFIPLYKKVILLTMLRPLTSSRYTMETDLT